MTTPNQESARRVLVTGASGFIGTHCLKPLLDRGFKVFAIHRQRVEPVELAGVKWVRCDLLNASDTKRVMEEIRPTHLLGLAWFVEPGKLITDLSNIDWLAASLQLLSAFREHGGSRCVFSGSCYEYDWRYGYCVENITPREPDTLYGAAKNSLSNAQLAYCAASGLSGAWARIFFLYGPHENPRRLVSSIILSLLKGEPALASHGNQLRDYMHVQDVANGLVSLLDSSARGAYNIASGRPTSIRSIVEHLGELTGRPDLLKIGALPARANDAPLVVGDPTAALRDFNWQSAIPLIEGLKETVNWWRRSIHQNI